MLILLASVSGQCIEGARVLTGASINCIMAVSEDLFLGPSDPVPSLPTCEANCLLDELLSAPPSPPMFDTLTPPPPLSPPEGSLCTSTAGGSVTSSAGGSPAGCLAPEPLVELMPPPAMSPDPLMPQQMSLDHWVPTLTPPLPEPLSPPSGCDESRGLMATPPDWSPPTLAPPAKRRQARPRPYDKQARRQITEEERRQRKKEQNKSAATRYRQKKKEEQELISTDQEQLEAHNAQLKERVNTLTRELSYLKHLMKEVIKFKRSM
ncbi:Cyclic AMP-dependent transcription factor ATF-4 [Amphibalanus amphitrite]|uniref:Cyclic AMP-dependent transcription factor ATF-4 n=1 Tax=Amphibalanus amphitrite TaxID=1232801 RepID=A0A6A4WX43_AMPAM|nr:Cyclic AMP-dependent transcription factor ATF-4 [Amphibalanus amphitrite]